MESFKEFYEKYPNLAFIKTKKKVEKQEDLDDWEITIAMLLEVFKKLEENLV